MCTPFSFTNCPNICGWLIPIVLLIVIWDITWKAIGMWKAARNNELAWFICIAIFNTIGIIPIVYLFLDKNKKREVKD